MAKLNEKDRQLAIERAKAEYLEHGYAHGELKINRQHTVSVRTMDNDGYPHFGFEPVEFEAPVAELPHSCDEWVIGGPNHIRTLIADLEKALKEMES